MGADHSGPKIGTLSHVHDSLLVLLCIAYLFAAAPIISIIDCSNVAVPIMNTITNIINHGDCKFIIISHQLPS